MSRRLPPLAVILGTAGVIPFVICAVASFRPDPVEASLMLRALLFYGAVILSFIGAVHWGFALSSAPTDPAFPVAQSLRAGERRVERAQLMLGALPALIGWVALLIGQLTSTWWGLAMLIAGFAVTMGVERQAARAGAMPPGYIWLRWGVTIAVVGTLGAVLVLHLFGVQGAPPSVQQ